MKQFYPQNRTDLAAELIKSKVTRLNEHVSRTDVDIDEETSKKIGKPAGRYTTVLSDAVAKGEREYYERIISALTSAVKDYIDKPRVVMIVGLGNPGMTADALGASVVKRIRVTRNIENSDNKGVCTLCPNVLGVTGIESYDIVKGAAERVRPDHIVVVDSLCAAASERLAAAFQISDAGITPGSGVSNFRFRINRESMGCNVISVGVPLVVYARTLIKEAAGNAVDDGAELIVTPKDIDLIVEECAFIIASALNAALSKA